MRNENHLGHVSAHGCWGPPSSHVPTHRLVLTQVFCVLSPPRDQFYKAGLKVSIEFPRAHETVLCPLDTP